MTRPRLFLFVVIAVLLALAFNSIVPAAPPLMDEDQELIYAVTNNDFAQARAALAAGASPDAPSGMW